MYKFLFFFLMTYQFTVWGLQCSNLQDFVPSYIFPRDNKIQIVGNNGGTFCVGWIARIEDIETLQISQKLPGDGWSQPESIAFEDEKRSLHDFKLELDENNTMYALWELTSRYESDIFFSKKPHGSSWFDCKCLANEYYSIPYAIGLTPQGYAHTISECSSGEVSYAIEDRELSPKGIFCVSHLSWSWSNTSHPDKTLSIDRCGRMTASWVNPLKMGGIVLEYIHHRDGGWEEIEMETFSVDSRSYQECLVTGFPEDIGILLLPLLEGSLLASSSHQDSLVILGQEWGYVRHLSHVVDEKGNIGIAWEIVKKDRRGIGICIKPVGKGWLKPFELFPTEGKYKRPKIVEAPEGKFVIAWEKHFAGTSSIVGSTLSIQEHALSSIKQLSPLDNGSCKYVWVSLFFSKIGIGYIGWTLADGNQSTAQVAEIHL